ncbi:unnamed protein product [Fraxinus pennsylvanica]|uniref:Uncharacterized protein n=1 Tax=Fraxinus pennsylvanica TaxID=56036 RepID=A0AAD1ZYS0_9LAMI|nr:unnamed protein product [Fraxinus pennsylvanica]
MARFLLSKTRLYTSTSTLHLKPFPTFSSSNSILHKKPCLLLSKQSLGSQYRRRYSGMHEDNRNKRTSWILGILLTIVLPFGTNNRGPVLKLKDEVDTAVETIEHITEVVEKVAEVVDKVAEDIADDLPEGGRFRKAVDFIENVAEETAKDAHLLGDIIHKVQGFEEDVESIVESLHGEANKPTKEIKDTKSLSKL